MKANHNLAGGAGLIYLLFLISSKNNMKANHNPGVIEKYIFKLFLISSKNNMKANHNASVIVQKAPDVVFNILKEQYESKSQRL